jgi:hypothetical protein
VLAKLGTQLSLELLEVDRLNISTRTAINALLVTDNHRAQGLGEATDGLAKVTLEELDDGRGEVELVCALEHVLLAEGVGRHPLREVTNDLGRGRDLDDVAALDGSHISQKNSMSPYSGENTYKLVGLDVLLLDDW